MPKFFFDIHDDEFDLADDSGLDLADLATAGRRAATSLAQIAQNELQARPGEHSFAIHIRDHANRVVLKITMSVRFDYIP